jgi:hypothetical protein
MKKILCIGLIAVMVLSMSVLTGCKKKDAVEETTTTATTTEPTTTTEKETTKKKTYKDLYKSKLDALIDAYGSVNGGKLVDLDASGIPEMIIFTGSAPNFTTSIYTIENDEVVNAYEETVTGLRYWQSDASYEVWINESINPSAVVLFDSSDEWQEDKVIAVTMPSGTAYTEVLRAKAKGEPNTPDWSECKCTIDDESVSASDYGEERDRLEKGAEKVNPASSTLDSLRSALND